MLHRAAAVLLLVLVCSVVFPQERANTLWPDPCVGDTIATEGTEAAGPVPLSCNTNDGLDPIDQGTDDTLSGLLDAIATAAWWLVPSIL